MKAMLYKQKPKPTKLVWHGYASGDNKAIHFFDMDDKLICTLEKPDIIFINTDGLMIKGYEPNGVDRAGRQKYLYQEWYLIMAND